MTTHVLSTPTSDQPAAEQSTALDGVDYLLEFDWIERAGAWKLDLSTGEGVPLIKGMMLLPGSDLFQTLAHRDRPQGALLIRSPAGRVPDLTTLTTECELIYLTE